MTFIPRTFEQIRDDMIDFVRMQTDLTDFEVGSVIRTIIEAAALEDDEQYFQMVQLLDAFRLSTASGSDLDDRVEEYGIIRLQPASASGEVIIQDDNLITSTLAFDVLAGATSLILEDSSLFPTTGFPYTVRLGEGTVSVEEVSVTANAVGTNTLTVGAVVNDHNLGERVSRVTGAADKSISIGLRVQVPATADDDAIVYVTIESGTLVNGNYESTTIRARAEVPGSNGNVGTLRIIEFASAPPFNGAGVTNRTNFSGGRDLETDAQLRDRARGIIQALSRGTVLALKEGTLGIEDSVTGQRVVTSSLVESFVNDEVILYVDDGTGFTPDRVTLARSQLAGGIGIGAGTLPVIDASDFPEEGWVIVSPGDASAEVLEYSGVNYGTNTIALVGTTANAHLLGDEVALVDMIDDAAEMGANFFRTAKFPLVRNSIRLWVDAGSGPVLQAEGELDDYLLNRGTGQIEFTGSGLTAGAMVFASYDYYTGLLAEVQKVVDGDPGDPSTYPGIRAAGVRVVVETPVIRRITVRVSITAQAGIQEADLVSQVQEAIESYINGLGVGEDVIVAEIIERAMAVSGMFDMSVALPTGNIAILEDELPVPFDVSGNSLVTVT